MKHRILSALFAFGLVTGAALATDTGATPPTEAAKPAPKAGVSSLWRFSPPPGARDQNTDYWIRQELLGADRDIQRGHYIRARHRCANVRQHLQDHWDARYRRVAQRIYEVEGDIARGSYAVARQTLRRIVRNLGNGGGGGGGQYYQVLNELNTALSYLDSNQPYWARQNLGRAYQIMIRAQDQRLRLESNQVRYADQLAARQQSYQAGNIVRGVIARLQHGGGGGGGGGDQDYENRQEWRRDIRDLMDTIMGGNLRMARRDLETLKRDIRQDGYNWNVNRQYVQRLNYIGQNLYRGNEQWCIQQLRQLSRQLNH